MATNSLFQISGASQSKNVSIEFEGASLEVPAGISVAAALLSAGVVKFRTSIVGEAPRAPFCMMGVCFECLLEIDGVPSRQSCMIGVRDGMIIKRQAGGKKLPDFETKS